MSCRTLSLQSVQPWKSVSLDSPPVLSEEGLSQQRELVLALLILCCGFFSEIREQISSAIVQL